LCEGITPSFSADGRSVLFARDGRLLRYVLANDGEQEVVIRDRVLNRLPKHSPAESPDGRRLVFQCSQIEDSELRRKRGFFCVCDSDGGAAARFDVETLGGGAVWSPDSSRLVFWNYEGGARVFVSTAAGEREVRFHGLCPAFSDESNRIAYKDVGGIFVRSLRDERWQADGEPTVPAEGVRSPGFNPIAWIDGKTLLVEEGGGVWSVELQGGEVTSVGDIPGIIRRGTATLAWRGGGLGFAAEVEGEGGSVLVVYEADSSA